MEKIVYILGAGFSAPLGLPVMSNFLEKSKDQYAGHSDQYAHFRDIFERELKQVHIASDHYQTNVFNIEDILSILEFRARLDTSEDGEERLDKFIRYLKDVIEFHTPIDDLKRNAGKLFVGDKWDAYIRFVAAILKCNFVSTQSPVVSGYGPLSHIFTDLPNPEHNYAVITFNYDRVLENVEEHFRNFRSLRGFQRSINLDDPLNHIHFAKLHGSIDGEIIPPTWNKGLHPNLLPDWEVAYKVLSEANQIRILGYSLPITDTYFRFLLCAAIIDTPNLKWIDVICKDENGSVKKSYDDFVKYPKYRFAAADIEEYLEMNRLHDDREGNVSFSLENAHDAFMRSKAVMRS